MAKGKRIHLPLNKTQKPRVGMNPFFPIEVQKYLREDGKDDGLRAIVNSETKDTLGRISDGYNVVTHESSSNIVRETLDKIGIKYNVDTPKCGNKGARFLQTVAFPELAFNPAAKLGLKSTAIDVIQSGGHNLLDTETLIPYIVVKNSYDGTSRLAWDYGFARPFCSNGSSIITSEDTLSFKHNQEINLEHVRNVLFSHIEKNSSIMEQVYDRLNRSEGNTYLQNLIEGDYPDKFKLAVLEKIAPFATIKSVTSTLEGEKKQVMEIESITTKVSAWAVWNVATDASTHYLPNVLEQDKVNRRIAKAFAVR